MRLRDEEIAAIVLREVQQALGFDSDVLATKRQYALELYHGQMAAPAEGRSAMVSLDVADAVHATLAQISPVVRTSQIEFEAQSQDDEVAARTESDFVAVSIERAGGFDIVDKASFDALLIGNGWLHVYVDESKVVTEQRFPPNLTDEQTYAITSMAPPDVEVKLRAGKEYSLATVTKTVRALKIECVAPEDMLFSENGSDFDLDEVRFVARRRLYTASQLKDKGIPQNLIDELPDALLDASTGQSARLGMYSQQVNGLSVQDANRLKVVYCCYIRLAPGDGNTSELRHVWIGERGTALLINEPADYIPFITGSAIPMPHRIVGTGFYELLGSIQQGKTHTLRQWMDNLTVMNASRMGVVEGQVNMGDLLNGRINGVVRMRSPDSIVPLPAADIGPQAQGALTYLDSVRTQRVGASLDFSEVQAQLMGTSATAAAGQLSKVEMMGGWFATNIVRTLFLPLFKLTHRILRTELGGPVMARIGGKWQQTDTSQWQERMATSIQMGMTTTEKAERMMALNQTITQLQQMMGTGGSGIITDLPRLFNAMSDWIRTANLGSPDQYLIDPKSPEAQQAQQAQAQQQEAQMKQQMQIQVQLTQLQQDFELEKQRRDLEYKAWSDKLDAEVEEAKMTSSGVIKMRELSLTAAGMEKEDKEDMDEAA